MREITEDLLDRMSRRVLEKLDALNSEASDEPVDDSQAMDREAVVKQVLRDELT